MKTAAKVFIIIGMICGFWMILPLIFGGVALSKMKTEKPSTGLSVCVLLFCSLLGGIFLLCSKDEEYLPAAAPAPVAAPAPAPAPAPAAAAAPVENSEQ